MQFNTCIPYQKIADKYHISILDYTCMDIRSEAEAKEKWEQRCKRVSLEKLLVIGSEVDHCNNDDIVRFMKLNYKDKLFLGKKKKNLSKGIYCHAKILSSPYFKDLYTQAHFAFKFLLKRC